MISLKGHLVTNLVLNFLLAACLGITLGLDLFSLLDYKVGVFTITHRLKYEDVSGDVFATFKSFESFACPSSQEPGIVTICGNIINFQTAGGVYFSFSVLIFGLLFLGILNLFMMLFHHSNWVLRFWYPHVLHAPLFIIAGSELLLVSNVNLLESPSLPKVQIAIESGIPMVFVTALVAIVALLHYLFLRKYRNLRSWEESAVTLVCYPLSSQMNEFSALGIQTESASQGHAMDSSAHLRTTHEGILRLKRTQETSEVDVAFHARARQTTEAKDEIEVIPVQDSFGVTEQEVADLKKENSELRIRIETLAGQLERANSEKAAAEGKLSTASRQLSDEQRDHSTSRKTIEDLQTHIEVLLKEVANAKGVEQVKRLLEDEKQQELERQKLLFTQQVKSRDEDISNLRVQVERLKRESAKKDDAIAEQQPELASAKSHIQTLEGDLADVTQKLKAIEGLHESIQKQKIDLELKVASLAADLSSEQVKYKHLDDLHRRSLLEMGQASNSQLESLKKMYEENLQREIKTIRENESSKGKKVQAELAKVQSDLKKTQEASAKLSQDLKAKTTRITELESQNKKQKPQVDTLTMQLAHAQTEGKKSAEALITANRRAQELADELASLQTTMKSQEDLRRKMLAEMENRHEAEKERLKAAYKDTQEKEVSDLKDFYEQMVAKLRAEVVMERGQRAESMQTAEQAMRNKDQAASDLARLTDQYLKVKSDYENMQTTQQYQEGRLHEILLLFAKLKEENAVLRSRRLSETGSEAAAAKSADDAKQSEIDHLHAVLDALKTGSSLEITKEIERLLSEIKVRDSKISELTMQKQDQAETIQMLNVDVDIMRAAAKEAERKLAEKPSPESASALYLAKLERKKEKLKKLRADLETIEKNKAKSLTDSTESYRLENEWLNDIYMKAFQEQKDDVVKMYEGMIASLKSEREKLRAENKSQTEKLADCNASAAKVRKELELAILEKDTEVEVRQKLYRQYQELKALLEQRETELKDLTSILDLLHQASGSDVLPLLEAQVRDLSAAKLQSTRDLEQTRQERDELQQELTLRDAELQTLREEYGQMQREFLPAKQRPSLSWEGKPEKSQGSSHSMRETLVIEGLVGEQGPNPILEKIASLRRESPMTYSNVWKLFESLMSEKARLDRMELSAGRPVRSVKDFILDFVYMQYGLKKLALRQLKALVVSLQELHKSEHPYGTLFARLLGLFHPRPIQNGLATFLMAAQEWFSALTKEKRTDTFTERYDIMQYGGQISIIDAMELVVRLSQGNREAGERIITQLLPSMEDNPIDLTLTKVCGTLARMGKDAEYVFDMLDRDKGGFVDYHEFVDGIRVTLNICITQDEAEDLCAYINDRCTGDISREEWLQKVDFETYAVKAESKEYMVTKCTFLSALVEEFDREVVQDYYFVRSLIKKSLVDQKTAFDLLRRLEPLIDDRTMSQIYEEARDFDRGITDEVSPEALSIVVLRNRVGGLGVGIFGIQGLELAVGENEAGRRM